MFDDFSNQVCTSFVKFILKYVTLFDAILNGIVLLVLFLDCPLLAYRHIVYLKKLILYPEPLLNLFMFHFCRFHRLSYIQDYVVENEGNFTFSFPTCVLFFVPY